MNKADRDALRALYEAATTGEWESVPTPRGIFGKDWREIRSERKRVVQAGSFECSKWDETWTESGVQMTEADSLTICSSHNALPEPLAAADRAERREAALSPIFAAISAERDRQERLLIERNWKWSMATPGIEPALKLMPLMEEVGEVAHAVRRQDGFAVAGNSHDNHGLRAELIQVAACAVAWVGAIDAEAREALAQPEEARE